MRKFNPFSFADFAILMLLITSAILLGFALKRQMNSNAQLEKATKLCSPFAYITHNDKNVVCESIDPTRAQYIL